MRSCRKSFWLIVFDPEAAVEDAADDEAALVVLVGCVTTVPSF
jgi:hypothetical protein